MGGAHRLHKRARLFTVFAKAKRRARGSRSDLRGCRRFSAHGGDGAGRALWDRFWSRLLRRIVHRPAGQPCVCAPARAQALAQHVRLHRLLFLGGCVGRRADGERRSFQEIARPGTAEFRVERAVVGGTSIFGRRRARCLAPAGAARREVRCHYPRSAHFFSRQPGSALASGGTDRGFAFCGPGIGGGGSIDPDLDQLHQARPPDVGTDSAVCPQDSAARRRFP